MLAGPSAHVKGGLGLLLLPPKPADQSQKALETLSPCSVPTVKQSLDKLLGHTLLSSDLATTQVWHHTPLLPPVQAASLTAPLPSMLLTVAGGNEREGTQNKSQTLYQTFSPACPLPPSTMLQAAVETLLPQHLCTCCSFCQEDTSPRSFIELSPL